MKHVSDEDRARVGELLKRGLESARECVTDEHASELEAQRYTRALDALLAWEDAGERLARRAEALRCDAEERVEQCKGAARVLSMLEQKRIRWCNYASSAAGDSSPTKAAEYADSMLELEEQRFGP